MRLLDGDQSDCESSMSLSSAFLRTAVSSVQYRAGWLQYSDFQRHLADSSTFGVGHFDLGLQPEQTRKFTPTAVQQHMMDPSRWTQKTVAALNAAQQLAQEHSHQQVQPTHLAVVLFEDEEGVGKRAVLRVGNEETLRSVLRVLKKQLVRLPSIDPAPDQVDLSASLRKVLQHASKLQKEGADTFVGVDTLLRALLENKDIATALSEAGKTA